MNSRLVGIVLIVIGLVLAVLAGIWLMTQVNAGMTIGAATLGAAIAFIPVALLEGFGLYLVVKGGAEQKQMGEMQKQRQLLDIVKSRGQVDINNLALEMALPVAQIQNMIHQLVGLQVFSGYINWDGGILYSEDASKLRELDKCKNCGGEITLAGKGVVRCRFCGTEYFLS
ncbi:MAG: hypothetical protein IAE89_04520 [Anaerolineae bacterium]|nr:hypothetical protein [Anaerolineae bacterium]